MDVVKLPKKVRMVCYEIMDGKEEALDTLESFADKYPHQVAAVKAEVAYFNLDYEKALALDLTILPWLEEWYYSNVSDEHMLAMTVAAIQLHREQELIEALTKEQARIRAENGLPQRDRFCDILMDYLKRGVMPFADNDKNYPYHEPEEPQTKEQLWAKLVEQNKRLSPDDPDARRKLYNHCCMFGTARDAVELFEEIQGVPNCALCSMHLGGYCPGCGGGAGNQSCAIAKCSLEHGGIQFCWECPEYPCSRYDGFDDGDSFVPHRNRQQDIALAREVELDAYLAQLEEKRAILDELLAGYNDGRRKTLFNMATYLLPLEDLRSVKAVLDCRPELAKQSVKERALAAVELLQEAADRLGISLKLNKKLRKG